jgi:hypothetical protein
MMATMNGYESILAFDSRALDTLGIHSDVVDYLDELTITDSKGKHLRYGVEFLTDKLVKRHFARRAGLPRGLNRVLNLRSGAISEALLTQKPPGVRG